MKNMQLFLPLGLAVLAHFSLIGSTLSAQTQTTISPKSGAVLSSGNNLIPWATRPSKMQQIFAHYAFTNPKAMVMRSIRLRMASGYANGRYGGQTITVAMWISLASKNYKGKPVSPGNISLTYTQNVDATTTKQVIARKNFTLPRLKNNNFDIKFPFDSGKSFLWPGAAGKRSLVVEVRVYGNSAGNSWFTYPINLWDGRRPSNGGVSQNGLYKGCSSSTRRTVQHYGWPTLLKVNSPKHYMTGFAWARSKPCLAIIGANSALLRLPGTSCYLVQDLVFSLSGVSSSKVSSGMTNIKLPIPDNPKLAHLTFYSQMFWLDAKANALGITSSRGLKQKIGPGPNLFPETIQVMTLGWKTTSNPDLMLTSPGAASNRGHVFQFTN